MTFKGQPQNKTLDNKKYKNTRKAKDMSQKQPLKRDLKSNS